jgi:membrane associated rhomboid family serine protease
MLPIAEVVDESRRERALATVPAVVVGSLVVANIAAFVYEMALIEAGDDELTLQWGLVPRVLTRLDPRHGVETIFTSMFLHGGWAHVLGNLWFLWIFGRSVERNLGSLRFLALYLLSGIAAAVVQVAVDPLSRAPMIGASGAIAGVLSAYVSLYPWRRIRTLVPIFIFPMIFSIPAFVIVFEWFVLNLYQGLGALHVRAHAQGGTAWWAHVGGFVAGLVLVRLLFPESPPPTPRVPARPSGWDDEDDRGDW